MTKPNIVNKIKDCRVCEQYLPYVPKPILQYSANVPICIIGQAPGIKAHNSGKPWDDASGERLRNWLGIGPEIFYDNQHVSIVPMGFCYPGKGTSGDLPPRPECAPKWHPSLVTISSKKLVLLIGKHAQDYYLNDKLTLTERIQTWSNYSPQFIVLPHPSPRNNIWLKRNAWFEAKVLPDMQKMLSAKLHTR